jgi:DNA-binding NarL/FixJ family response regulator
MSIRVLVVEDEAIVAIDIADQLIEAGYLVVGPAPSVAKALKLIEEVGCDVAVLDVNLRDETSEPVARELRLPPDFTDEVLVSKPARSALLIAAIQRSIAEHRGIEHQTQTSNG